jgi:hypothetical protein
LRFYRRDADEFDRIQTWALEEARRRLEKEGILEDPDATAILEEKEK